MFRFIFASLLLVGLFDHIYSNDYCTNTLCRNGAPNIGCNPPPLTGGPNCYGRNPELIPITPTLQARILDQHNTLRSLIAVGGVYPFYPARRMPTLVWDAELASQAGHNARSCVFQHDPCRNTVDFAWAGQNLGGMFGGGPLDLEYVINELVAMWWNEYSDTPPAYIDSFPSNHVGPAIGHFTQIVSDRTWAMGCAMQSWLDDGFWIMHYLVCNYSFTNVVGVPVYATGTTASGCTTGMDWRYPGLCSENEIVQSLP
ncbi:venom allergen 3-like [Anopheles funestus]|uniref:venom allergen 3-like n=1 Tax=Anopheles funestus TaxID=62324 RepID=UPI0020C6DE68|nr:venom allergen 3-like [Anopheles funestus]